VQLLHDLSHVPFQKAQRTAIVRALRVYLLGDAILPAMAFQLIARTRIFRRFLLLSFASLFFPLAAQTGAVNPVVDPKDAVGWFERASDQMNLRGADGVPFHMKVTFKALPGLELLEGKKKPQIMTGDGVYEETWMGLHHWRREVTFGDYHAVEVESPQGRKMQASSDYEPSRVLMLLAALLYPIPRQRTSPELGGAHVHWTVQHQTAGDLPFVLVNAAVDVDREYKAAYIFLPSGMLVQSNELALATSWQNQIAFAGHVVPQQLTIQAGGRTLLTADIKVEAAGQTDPAIFELPVETADPGMTLRPLSPFEVRLPGLGDGCTVLGPDSPILPLVTRLIIDRHGVAQEVELLDARNLQVQANSKVIAGLLDCSRRMKVRPATIDKDPAELAQNPLHILRFSHK
jgi:hypothetical protein